MNQDNNVPRRLRDRSACCARSHAVGRRRCPRHRWGYRTALRRDRHRQSEQEPDDGPARDHERSPTIRQRPLLHARSRGARMRRPESEAVIVAVARPARSDRIDVGSMRTSRIEASSDNRDPGRSPGRTLTSASATRAGLPAANDFASRSACTPEGAAGAAPEPGLVGALPGARSSTKTIATTAPTATKPTSAMRFTRLPRIRPRDRRA